MGGGGGGSQASMRHLTNIFRRVYRIFAHAWFQHRGVFWQVEGHEGLYVFFKTVCDVYQLIPEDNYTIPNEAEGGDGDTMETPIGKKSPEVGRMNILKMNTENGPSHVGGNGEGDATTTVSVGATTRRHKHTPSTGSHVTTIAEGLEEEEQSPRDHEKMSPEQPDPPRGRSLLSGEETIAHGLGKLSLGDLGPAANHDGPAEQPTPQPQNVEKNPMEEFEKCDDSVTRAEAIPAEDATDSTQDEETKTDQPEGLSDKDELLGDSKVVHGIGGETAPETRGKEKEEKTVDDTNAENVEVEETERIEKEAKAS
jgi:Mob1/phocein family